MIEYRVCWSASSNVSFQGATDWERWVDDEDDATTADEVVDALNTGRPAIVEGFEIALEASGFEWWVETREGDQPEGEGVLRG